MVLPSLLGSGDRAGAGTGRQLAAPAALPPARVAPLADAGELPPLDPWQRPWPGREMTYGGVTMHVRETPAGTGGTPAVYVHGLSGSATNFTDLAGQLAPHAPGLALDLPGFGRSRPLSSGLFTPAAQADALLCFLAGQGRPVHLVGNSLGGAISLMVAARRPELVRSLTLLAPAMPDRRPDPRRVSDPRLLLALVPWLRARVGRQMAEVTPRQGVEQMLRLCFGDPSGVPEHRILEAIEEVGLRVQLPWAREALLQAAKGMFRGWFLGPGLWSMAARVQIPTLVVWGGRDRLMSPRLARRTTVTLPHARLLALPEVGHVPQIETPVTVARAVLGLWRAVDAGSW
ncbi:MAG TPA: alpha/beta fold hydrolase [Pseudonocardia sp.]|jgi:pimeloyl-ACP methyl ester carboxylesterase|nr:alpha/beta fold hydrolase [Pseudonocardia sp.]